MSELERFAVVAIPLSRPDVVDFLLNPGPQKRGALLRILGQRPTAQAEARWIEELASTPRPTIGQILAIDDLHGHLIETSTDRLVPVESLAMPDFLTRDLGGWVSNYFGLMGLPQPVPDDPVLNCLEILIDYGSQIRFFGPDSSQVSARLEEEVGGDVKAVSQWFLRLAGLRREMARDPMAYVERIYGQLASQECLAIHGQGPIPPLLLYDELISQLVRLEQSRRASLAEGKKRAADQIAAWQQAFREQHGLRLILQGEYIVGRHRRSTVLIAPDLGVVIKQPGPEPFHEIELGARFVQGRYENWPYLTLDGALVTARGRVRLTIEEGLIPRLNRVFGHPMRLSALLGLTVEPFVAGTTVQDLVLGDHHQLNPRLYESIMLHQQVCELLGIENGDWHAPNFVQRASDGKIVHIDWGAARPLRSDEITPQGKQARINQVSNMAFSFKDPDLAQRLKSIHQELVADPERMAKVRSCAQTLVDGRTQ